jgi:hypothetical protein
MKSLGAALQADGKYEVTVVMGLKHQKEKRLMCCNKRHPLLWQSRAGGGAVHGINSGNAKGSYLRYRHQSEYLHRNRMT